jgi:flagellar motility protein MotE (MotC chaperone)
MASLPRNRKRRPAERNRWLACLTGIALLTGVPAVASEDGKAGGAKEAAEELPMPTTPVQLSPAEQYCANVIDAAAAAQIAEQTRKLEKAQKTIDDRVALLSAKTEELKKWVKKREDFTTHATDALVEIYSKMKPDAAANQLAAMDELTAAAITSKLSPKVSSLMLAEMDAGKAARLTSIVAGAGEVAAKLEAMANAHQQ